MPYGNMPYSTMPAYPGMYQSAYMPGQNPYQTGVNTPVAQRYEVIRVNGENGARAFQMAPNSSVLLLDETAPVVWLAQSDGAGYRTVTPYNITPAQTKEQEGTGKYDFLESRVAKLEELINARQSYPRGAQSRPNGGSVTKSGAD